TIFQANTLGEVDFAVHGAFLFRVRGETRTTERTTARKSLQAKCMAEREGFEPPIPFQVCRFSRPVPSTTRPPLRLLQFYYSPQFSPDCALALSSVFKGLQTPNIPVQWFSRPPVSTTHASLRSISIE